MAIYNKNTGLRVRSGDGTVRNNTASIYKPWDPSSIIDRIKEEEQSRSSSLPTYNGSSRIGASAPQLPFEEPIQIGKKKDTTPTQIYEEATEKAVITPSRLASIITGAAKSTASGYASALGTTQAVTGGVARKNYLTTDMEQWQKELEAYRYKAKNADDAEEQKYFLLEAGKTANKIEAAKQNLLETETAGQSMQQTAKKLSASAQQDIQEAKQGLGKVGSFLVDTGVAGAQMLGDVAVGALTGGSALPAMFLRSAGSSAQEAREAGGTLGQQVAYGLGSGALSVATEKLLNVSAPFKKAFGEGVLDSAITKAAGKLGSTTLGKVAISAISEGGEEFAEALMQPILQMATYDKNAIYDEEWLSNALHDAAIGAALGSIGGGVETVAANKQVPAKPRDPAMPGAGTQTADAAGTGKGNAESTVQGNSGGILEQEIERLFGKKNAAPRPKVVDDVLTREIERIYGKKNTASMQTAGTGKGSTETGAQGSFEANSAPMKVGRVTTIQNPYAGTKPVQASKNAAAVTVDSGSVETAKNRIEGARGIEARLPGQGFKATLKNAYKSVFKAAKGVPVEGVTFDGQPYLVDINSNVPGKVISDPNLSAEKLALLDVLPEVVRNGEYVGSSKYVQHGKKAKQSIRYDYFETPVVINGKEYIAAFSVDVEPNVNNYRTHRIEKMDLKEAPSLDTGTTPAAAELHSDPANRTSTEASLAGPAPAASSVGSRSISDTTISQESDFVNQGDDDIPIDSPEGRQQFPYTNRVLDDSREGPGTARENAIGTDGRRSIGSAAGGFSVAGTEGTEQVSRMARHNPYNAQQEAATALTKEDYDKLFRYESQTEERSTLLAEGMLYMVKDGQRTFLKDIDEESYSELIRSLEEASAWNGPQTDAAHMIQRELQGRSVNMEVESEEYVDWLRIMREHETATGQGVQANAKWSRTGNESGASSEMDAWENLEKSNLSDQEKQEVFRQVVKWDSEIETAKSAADLKRIIMEIANRRGVVNGVMGKQFSRIAESALDSLTTEQLRQFAYRSSAAATTDHTPVNQGQKLKTVQILNMLSNPETAVKNILGNATFYGIDAVSMDGAALLDMALSNITGTRSVAAGGSSLSSAVKALQMSIAEITLDVDMSRTETRYGTNSTRTFKADGSVPFLGSKFLGKIMSSLERNQAYLLTATDEFFKGAAKGTAAATQTLIDQGKIKNAGKDYAKTQAEQLAKYRTFQDDSDLSAALRDVRDILNTSVFGISAGVGDSGRRTASGKVVHSFGVGDIVAPFTKVAGNIVVRGAEYSPINLAKGALEVGKVIASASKGELDPAMQAKAVTDLMRGMTGTTLACGFMFLAKAGLLRRASDEDDENVAALNQSEGMSGTQLNITAAERAISGGSAEWQTGDTLVDLSTLEPLNLIVNQGVEMAKNPGNLLVSTFNATLDSVGTASANLPVVEGIGEFGRDVFLYGKDWKEAAAEQAANTLVSSVTPNILRAVAQGTDDRPRNAYTGDSFLDLVADDLKSRVPVLRQTLPGSVDSTGQEKTYQGSQAKIFTDAVFNPIGVNTYEQGEVSKELERVREATGDSTFYPTNSIPKELSYTDDKGNEHTEKLDYKARQNFQYERGTTEMVELASVMGTKAYKSASADKQAKLLNDVNTYAYEVAKASVLGKGAAYQWVQKTLDVQESIGLPTSAVIIYRDMLSDEKSKDQTTAQANRAVRAAIFEDKTLSAKQKNALDNIVISDGMYIPKEVDVDYSNASSFARTLP